MTREEILSIEEYCTEYKITHRKCLEEFGILYKSKPSIVLNTHPMNRLIKLITQKIYLRLSDRYSKQYILYTIN